MNKIEKIIKNTNEKNQSNVDWTKVWSEKYPVLSRYQNEVDIKEYASNTRNMINKLKEDYNYSELDAMLVLKDILWQEYKKVK